MGRPLNLSWALVVAPALAAQTWPTFYSAYEDGLAAQRQGDHGLALRAFTRSVQLEPEPSPRIKTYGLNFMSGYYPYLRMAESALALGDLDRAEGALRDSAKWAKEPAPAREALLQRLRQARAAREAALKPKEVVPAPKAEPIAEPPRPAPAKPQEVPAPSTPEPVRALPLKAPEHRPEPQAAALPKATPPVVAPKEGPAPIASAPAKPPAPSKEAGPDPAAAPARETAPSKPLWLGLGLGSGLAVAAAAWTFLRRRKPRPGAVTLGTNPYKVDLDSHKKSAPTMLSPGRATAEASGPRRVGPYVVAKVLGRGGCATTYLAVHEEDGTEVAVKVPHPHIIIDPEFLARFRREAELGSVLDHPRIVRILDPGPKDGDAWIAMTLVRGTTLESHITQKKGPLELPEVIHIAFDVAEAITHAHSKGVVHRDLKPANIMLGEAGAQVMDFGIARVLDTSMTSTTVFIGTPSYSAPESLVNPRVGPPADRYALGIILFEMVTGRLPFTGETTFQVLEKHRSEPLPDLNALRPGLPPRLVRLVERLTSKKPEERPEDGEVLTILAALQKEHPLPT